MHKLAYLFLLFATALAATGTNGWTEGVVAEQSSRVLAPMAGRPSEIDLPPSLDALIETRALLVYLSPTCPHCRHITPELNQLTEEVAGEMQVLALASGLSDPAAIEDYKRSFAIKFPIHLDMDGSWSTAMGIRSTPSAVMLERRDGQLHLVDLWYPYRPGSRNLVKMRLSDDPWSIFTPGTYQGNTVCGSCHQQERDSWLLSHHSIAWRTLEQDGEHTNPECVNCHVTGAGLPTGWTKESDGLLTSVGCESCHGAGGPHDGTTEDARASCEGCHDDKHSINFRVEKGVPLIDHFLANGMSDADFSKRRQQLYKGEAPRPLLSFDEGTYVGSAACKDCHATEHEQWTTSPHGTAMARLHEGEGANDVACVTCHATPLTAGVPPTAIDGFRTSEGVGCESCHGPGGKHVDAKGASGTIEGLGESCPVCVIEAVCTSCHTSQWDPTWDLDERLIGVRAHHGLPPKDKAKPSK